MERILRVCGEERERSFCFFSWFFSGKFLREREGKEEGEEDRLKSAKRIKSFCHDNCPTTTVLLPFVQFFTDRQYKAVG